MPWSAEYKADLNKAFDDKKEYYEGDDVGAWLDSMSYKYLLEEVMGLSPKVTEYFDPILAISMGAVGSDVYSAYAAKNLDMPGTSSRYAYDKSIDDDGLGAYSYPGGNSGSFRHIVKYLIPNAISEGRGFEEILNNPINFSELDKPENPISIRLNSTAIDVRHEGTPEDYEFVNVTYYVDGKVKKVKAKTVMMGIGGWIAKNISHDMPVPIKEAYNEFHHGPMLVVNIAVRNWRFLDKLGISTGRWVKGMGNFFSIRRPMDTGDAAQPFDPDKPIVMTYYAPFVNSGHPIKEQGKMGRYELLSKSYAEYENEIIEQMTDMFSDYGFDAERDVAGIILNRWGHAYVAPQPGFFFGKDGKPAPRDIVKQGYGRIQFGHSELSGYMSHTTALNEESMAAKKLLDQL